jgi:pimeloyl-ACP methyl ester carboxylesterase
MQQSRFAMPAAAAGDGGRAGRNGAIDLAALAERFRVILVDLPRFGRSDKVMVDRPRHGGVAGIDA